VRIAFLIAACREKIWFKGGAECGEDRGKVMIIKRALYGLRLSGAAWRNMLAQTIEEMGFTSTVVDPNVWRRQAVKPSGEEYHAMLLVFVDDILIISHEAVKHIDALKQVYTLKPEVLVPQQCTWEQMYRRSRRRVVKCVGVCCLTRMSSRQLELFATY